MRRYFAMRPRIQAGFSLRRARWLERWRALRRDENEGERGYLCDDLRFILAASAAPASIKRFVPPRSLASSRTAVSAEGRSMIMPTNQGEASGQPNDATLGFRHSEP